MEDLQWTLKLNPSVYTFKNIAATTEQQASEIKKTQIHKISLSH